MVEKVIWIKRAIRSFNNIVSYLRTDWSYEIADEFYNRTHIIIDLIKDFPEIGSLVKQRRIVRRFLITRHNYIIYRTFKNKLIIVDFVDTRKKQS